MRDEARGDPRRGDGEVRDGATAQSRDGIRRGRRFGDEAQRGDDDAREARAAHQGLGVRRGHLRDDSEQASLREGVRDAGEGDGGAERGERARGRRGHEEAREEDAEAESHAKARGGEVGEAEHERERGQVGEEVEDAEEAVDVRVRVDRREVIHRGDVRVPGEEDADAEVEAEPVRRAVEGRVPAARLARRVAEGGGAWKGEPGVVARRGEHRGGDGRRPRRPARGGVSRGVFDDEAPRRRAVYDALRPDSRFVSS